MSFKIYGQDTIWKEYPQYQGRYDFAVRQPPPGAIDTVTTDCVTALVYQQRIWNVPLSKPTYYFTHFHWDEPDGKHTVSRKDLVRIFESMLETWESYYHVALDLEEGRRIQLEYHDPRIRNRRVKVAVSYASDSLLGVVHAFSLPLAALSNMEHLGHLPIEWNAYEDVIYFRRPDLSKPLTLEDGKVSTFIFQMAEKLRTDGLPLNGYEEELRKAERELELMSTEIPAEIGWRRWQEVREPGKRHVPVGRSLLDTDKPLWLCGNKKWMESEAGLE